MKAKKAEIETPGGLSRNFHQTVKTMHFHHLDTLKVSYFFLLTYPSEHPTTVQISRLMWSSKHMVQGLDHMFELQKVKECFATPTE